MFKIRFHIFCLVLIFTAFCLPGVAVAREAPRTGQHVYHVVPGDNLYSIGLKYNVTVKELMKANNLGSTVINRSRYW